MKCQTFFFFLKKKKKKLPLSLSPMLVKLDNKFKVVTVQFLGYLR